MSSRWSKFILLLSLILLFFLLREIGLQNYLSLQYIQANLDKFKEFYSNNTFLTIISYSILYIFMTALSIPGATILTLLGGTLFGLWKGFVIISFASTTGATLAFLVSRFLLRDFVQQKFENKIKAVNNGIKKEGAFYLFSLRLVPIFPFFLINLVMGLTSIKASTFYIVSQLGMIPGTLAYVNAGLQLSQLNSLKGIISPDILISFSILGLLPLLSKKLLSFLKAKRIYKKFKRPKKYDYNMVVIGAGAAGLVTSYISAMVKAKVALAEKEKMGGDCLNTGCVPSKALIKSAKIIHLSKRASDFGLKKMSVDYSFSDLMERVQEVIKKIEPHDSKERYSNLGVECFTGKAHIRSPWEVEIDGKIITTKNITIATGARPFVPQIPGIEQVDYLTSENLWNLRVLPKKLVVLGGGPIGIEIAQCFARFGSEVSIVEASDRILLKEDLDVSQFMKKQLKKEGVHVLLNYKAIEFKQNTLVCQSSEGKKEINFDQILIAVGRKANVKGLGLESLKIHMRSNGTIETNEYLQTNYPNIYACGDVTGPYQLTHTASHQAWYCAVNGLFGRFKKFKVDYSVIPWCTYTDPEVATVGLNEVAAKEQGKAYEVTYYGIDDLDRAIAESEDYGFVKVLTKPKSDKIIGATIVGFQASDLILEFIIAMKHDIGLNKILGTIHPYPTMGEANKYVAGEWRKKHKPKWALSLLKKVHNWERRE